ncbi:MAG TPA: hypothetical protein PK572_08575, partial [Kiritimatiellia bacterium]|nr:hypothetical protein [Kiritimatiellia bacterium]
APIEGLERSQTFQPLPAGRFRPPTIPALQKPYKISETVGCPNAELRSHHLNVSPPKIASTPKERSGQKMAFLMTWKLSPRHHNRGLSALCAA